ncbi:conserved hypothetical protein [Methylobacterium sp. 4-46]|uniref:DUF3108 domain-containing protein n=1 Tax=unclassified Methylobacterium TaxID=2615210 RepID=UPI000165C75F|nr:MULTISPECIES: DUF3108 domain-containing protein [Methylobacterium]ACA18047.1 conserved hypothetical protein [Methylobacterium sp. 4-46]WFT77349.1 DUF3108 domain-containing protein [Methylobacterium nodulans]
MRAKPFLPALLAPGLLLGMGPADPAAAARARAAATAVTVDYGIMLAGVPIGTAQMTGAIEGQRYRMDVTAKLTGLVGAITGGYGSGRASGVAGSGRPIPGTFAVSSHSSSTSITVRMALARGNVVASEIVPPLLVDPERVPVDAASKRAVVDPVSALLMPAQGRGDLTDPQNCNRVIPVFDGASRFDVILSYGETRRVEKPGYAGPVLVCNARYRPITGHRPDKPGVKFMEENTDMSVWLAPVEGARVLLPLRISVRTMLGTNIIEATRWTQSGAEAQATQAAAVAQ